MPKSFKILIGLFVFLLLFIFYLEANSPEPLDWAPSYQREAKIPLGTQVFFDQLEESDFNYEINKRPLFELISRENDTLKTLFLVNNYIPIQGAERDSLLEWVGKGNTLFMATSTAPALLDTLEIKISGLLLDDRIEYKPLLSLANQSFDIGSEKIFERSQNYFPYIKEIDTSETTVLGQFRPDNDSLSDEKQLNFIKLPFEEGEIFVHTMPEVFSNHFLLTQDNGRYTSAVMRYFDSSQPLIWDAYYKTGRDAIDSPLHYLLNDKYLKITYYLLLISLLIFIIFEGKRKQKAIKVVEPVQNKSYEYVRTIADMYLDKRNHKKIAMLKIDLFLAKIRQNYHLPTQEIDQLFIKNLAFKSGQTEEEIINTFKYIERINSLESISKKDLILLEEYLNPYH